MWPIFSGEVSRVWGLYPHDSVVHIQRNMNALIKCFTAIILLESIDLILMGTAFIYPTHKIILH